MLRTPRLFERTYSQVFLRYIFAPLISYSLVNTLLIFFIEFLHLDHHLSFSLALLISLFVNNFILKFIVFSSQKNWIQTAAKLLLVSLSFRSMEFAMFVALSSFGSHYLFSSTFSMGIGALIKFFVLKRFVY